MTGDPPSRYVPKYINYHNEVAITLCCQLYGLTRYQVVKYKLKSNCVIKVASMTIFCYERKPPCATTELTLFAVSKDE